MGSGASNQNIPLSHNPLLNPSDEYFNNVLSPELSLEENGWIKISHTYETKDSFSSVRISLSLPNSILDNLFDQS